MVDLVRPLAIFVVVEEHVGGVIATVGCQAEVFLEVTPGYIKLGRKVDNFLVLGDFDNRDSGPSARRMRSQVSRVRQVAGVCFDRV